MRPTLPGYFKSRHRDKAPLTTLIALLALAGGAQAMIPAQAAAIYDQTTGAPCVAQDGVLIDSETGEVCTLEELTVTMSGSAPSTSPRQESSNTPPPCPAFGCLQKGQRQIGDPYNLFGSRDGPKGGGSARTGPVKVPPLQFCTRLKEWHDRLAKELELYLRPSVQGNPSVKREITEIRAAIKVLKQKLDESGCDSVLKGRK